MDGGLERVSLPVCQEVTQADPWQAGSELSIEQRGRPLGCAHIGTFTKELVMKEPFAFPSLGAITNGYDLFILRYVSEIRPGVAGAVTGLYYLPTGAERDLPLVALDHQATGLGPSCGPTRNPIVTNYIGVPFAARGHAVFAPDYAGMGVDNGMSSFLVGQCEAAATLDGLSALRRIADGPLDAKRLGRELFLIGYSQGAQAALFSEQEFGDGLGFSLLGTVAFAPALGSARLWTRQFDDASRPVDDRVSYGLMSLWAHMLYYQRPAANTWLTPRAQTLLPGLLHDQCLGTLPSAIAASFATEGDLYQKRFLAAAHDCSFAGACPAFEPWRSELLADEPGGFANPAPVLVVQGLADRLVDPGSVACIVDRLKAHGTPVTACAYPTADHLSVVGMAFPDVYRWVTARRAGQTIDPCSASLSVGCTSAP